MTDYPVEIWPRAGNMWLEDNGRTYTYIKCVEINAEEVWFAPLYKPDNTGIVCITRNVLEPYCDYIYKGSIEYIRNYIAAVEEGAS